MFLPTDALVVGLRALMFVVLFQAAGTAIFRLVFGDLTPTEEIAERIRRLARVSALLGLVLTLLYAAMSPARLAGSLDGVLDVSLVQLWLGSSAGTANIVRAVGLLLLVIGSGTGVRVSRIAGSIGVALALVSFLLMGHTSIQAERWLLAPLLLFHVTIIAAWFGALWPLYLVARDAPAAVAGTLVTTFSAVAIWVVPLIFVVGAIMAAVLIGSVAGLFTVYGMMVLAKTFGFALVMVLAALNKWRFGPSIVAGLDGAARALRRTVAAEAVLLVAILMTTAVMTSLFAPEHLHS